MVMDLPSDATLALSELKSSLLKRSENYTFGNRVSTYQFVKDQISIASDATISKTENTT